MELNAPGKYRAARDLLFRKIPRLWTGDKGAQLCRPGGEVVTEARRLVLELDGGLLPIQGPPGAGKTSTGARMICELVDKKKKVGITAVSHKVIRKLIEEALKAAKKENIPLQCMQKVPEKSEEENPSIMETTDNAQIISCLQDGSVQVAGGTAWLWARPEYAESVDVLFVDEAGQMSLADVFAVSQAAKNIVLLGDPQQLEQPLQGSHPPGVEVSALQHILGEHQTMPAQLGLFLDKTWRLCPAICDLTSNLSYESKLYAREELAKQKLTGSTMFAGSGLWFVPVIHDGNQSSSDEEADRIAEIVRHLSGPGVCWVDAHGESRELTLRDILIVAPYNSQVFKIADRIGGARVGTVDKFQGQEAPVVIYSLATSSPEDAPHEMEFLYSSNRFNVATSRARCACILVASPRLIEPECKTPRQMKLANAFCRYRELATIL